MMSLLDNDVALAFLPLMIVQKMKIKRYLDIRLTTEISIKPSVLSTIRILYYIWASKMSQINNIRMKKCIPVHIIATSLYVNYHPLDRINEIHRFVSNRYHESNILEFPIIMYIYTTELSETIIRKYFNENYKYITG